MTLCSITMENEADADITSFKLTIHLREASSFKELQVSRLSNGVSITFLVRLMKNFVDKNHHGKFCEVSHNILLKRGRD